MFPTGLVSAHHAVHVRDLVPGKCIVSRGGTVGRTRCPTGFLAANLELRPRICRNVLWPLAYYHCHAIPTNFGLCLNHRSRVRSVLTSWGGKPREALPTSSTEVKLNVSSSSTMSMLLNYSCKNLANFTATPRYSINMIDAWVRSLQLPVFLAAQQSINTFFFKV